MVVIHFPLLYNLNKNIRALSHNHKIILTHTIKMVLSILIKTKLYFRLYQKVQKAVKEEREQNLALEKENDHHNLDQLVQVFR